MSLAHQWRLFQVALQYFTRLPVPAMAEFDPAWLTHSARYFPLVGWLVGAACAGVFWVASGTFEPAIAAGLALATGVLLTGAFHEDGLADTCDALGGRVERERALEIMRDSRIGSYGSLALLLNTGLRWAALASLGAGLGALALFLMHPAARGGAASLMARLDYVRLDDSKAKPVAAPQSAEALRWMLGFAALPAALLGWIAPLATLAGLLAVAAVHGVCRRWYRRRLGGYTGDALGACEQLGETAFLLAFVAVAA
ncbi:adenosylcobinamide-GDP ribazoletransferase [Pseudomarimonas salicorniae]|uniref:Adenosylcobinamide-GDP ribazoletransferase n=1 Tax=Pseudomarimonas salicorniae TaxID=2933270 RepID=A0ABT0GK75_9GAMM|nr:adenosylcobinamide-GDP ribazoletransferase [Lysobacter sp. CAU 1642]MCK7594952.1 adenosylcobinamide-GDP ribazoletransferase [Lysobacter sp. CAU 1642]